MYNIAIDGPVGSGKSTLAKMLAKRLDFHFLDTGALYRGMACYFRYKNIVEINENSVNSIIDEITVKVKFIDNVQHVIVSGIDFTSNLREEEISMLSSKISNYPQIRDKILDIQRDFAKEYDCVLEGRDIGTVVLPNADLKIYLTANEKTRAQRRYEQDKLKNPNISYQEIFKDLKERDFENEHRKIAPLRPAEDSVIIDNSDIDLEQTCVLCENIFKQKIANTLK